MMFSWFCGLFGGTMIAFGIAWWVDRAQKRYGIFHIVAGIIFLSIGLLAVFGVIHPIK